MDIAKINAEAGKILAALNPNLNLDEKIASLEAAAWAIRSVQAAESAKLMRDGMLDNFLNQRKETAAKLQS
ncbi:MAG: hypothetical protein ABIC57_00600 [bacterium]